jgi:hypothetical protein
MVYSIIYDAVNKKVETEIPNKLISNLEMVAAIYQVLAELGVDDISETLKIQELMDEINDEKSKDTKKNILLAIVIFGLWEFCFMLCFLVCSLLKEKMKMNCSKK